MLRIKRSAPSSFFFSIVDEPRNRLIEWARRSVNERQQRRPPIDRDVFRAGHLVDMVVSDFDGCCAFCERRVGASEGVHHFRPISAFDERGGLDGRYAWLAYEWWNLFVICSHCEKARADRFPVSGPRARFMATFDEVRAQEHPRLIDPTRESPSQYLSFLFSGECFPKSEFGKGATTVDVFQLNDVNLIAERRSAIELTIEIFRQAIQSRLWSPGEFPADQFVGASRDVLRRILLEYGAKMPAAHNASAFWLSLEVVFERLTKEDNERMFSAIERVQNGDLGRRAQLEQRRSPLPNYSGSRVVKPSAMRLILPDADLQSVQISNFRAIDSVKIELPRLRSSKFGARCLLLLGENAVGKSTSLAAVALALLGTKEVAKLRLPHWELIRSTSQENWDVWGRDGLEVRLQFHDETTAAEFFYDPVTDRIDGTRDQTMVVLGYGPHRYFSNARRAWSSRSADRVRSLFDPLKPLPDASEWLAALGASSFNEVAKTMRTILPVGDDDELVNDRTAGICVRAQGQLTPIGQLSEGYRSIFAMVADICRSLLQHWSFLEAARAVVLIDEIETHLHPRWKMRIMSSLRRAFPQVQFIVTSHDPLCVRGMDDGEVVVLTRSSAGGIRLLDDLPSISGMKVEQLLTSEYFGLSSTIDPELQLDIARLAASVGVEPDRIIGDEANELIRKITVGDSAAAQVIHEALLRYLQERERPVDSLATDARSDAVAAVFAALRSRRAQ
jgi:uncharacterized protein (TIGR02646 family)